MSKHRGFLLGLFLFAVFTFFSYLLHKDQFTRFDFDITVRLQDFLPRSVDSIFSSLSLIGSLETSILILILLFFLLSKLRYFLVLMGFGLFHIIELFGKLYVDHPPPPFMFFRYEFDLFFPSSYIQPGSSFPSGHSGRAVFFALIFITLLWKSKLKKETKIILSFFLVFLSLLMLVSRVYLGEHWASDVIGGAILGSSIALVSLNISLKYLK